MVTADILDFVYSSYVPNPNLSLLLRYDYGTNCVCISLNGINFKLIGNQSSKNERENINFIH